MCCEGDIRRGGRSANLVVRMAFTPLPFLVVGGLASMEWSPLLRERMESVELSEYMVIGCMCALDGSKITNLRNGQFKRVQGGPEYAPGVVWKPRGRLLLPFRSQCSEFNRINQ